MAHEVVVLPAPGAAKITPNLTEENRLLAPAPARPFTPAHTYTSPGVGLWNGFAREGASSFSSYAESPCGKRRRSERTHPEAQWVILRPRPVRDPARHAAQSQPSPTRRSPSFPVIRPSRGKTTHAIRQAGQAMFGEREGPLLKVLLERPSHSFRLCPAVRHAAADMALGVESSQCHLSLPAGTRGTPE